MDAVRMEDVPHCMICGVKGEGLYSALPDRLFGVPGLFSLKTCRACRLIWLDPRPIKEDIPKCYAQYYTHLEVPGAFEERPRPLAVLRDALRFAILCGHYGYRHLHNGPHGLCRLGPAFARLPFLRYRAVFDDLRERFPKYAERKDRLLIDVGCGRGDFLVRMKDLGWNVLGIEPDAESARLAEGRGIPVFRGTLEEARLEAGIADQVTLQHVIEHLTDPSAVIRESFRVLRRKGRLVIYTPNNESLGHQVFKSSWLPLDPPRHLFVFAERSIRLLLEQSPFREYRIRTVPVSASKIYDGSLLIQREGKIDPEGIGFQKGRRAFAIEEFLRCAFGGRSGEEVEAVICKS